MHGGELDLRLASRTERTPWHLRRESITEVPRSLKDPVGLNHSHLK